MKKFTRLLSILMLIVVMSLSFGLVAGCANNNDDGNNDDNWDGRTYVVYVYLADGTTPVKDVRLALCYNTSTDSSCLAPRRTDANGKVEITIDSSISFVGNPVIHFTNENDIPSGYTLPTNMTRIEMTGGAVYEHGLALTGKTTKLILANA